MKILIADDLEEKVISEIKKFGKVVYKPENLEEEIADADVLIVRSATKVTKELLERAPNLKVVARAGVGMDNIDAEACNKRKIQLVNTPHAPSNAVAEFVIGLLICMVRGVQRAHLLMKKGIWAKRELVGAEITGKVLGIIGYGNIGKLVGEKAKALGMDVIVYSVPPQAGVKSVSFDELLRSSDVITLHVPLTPKTKGMINRETIEKMKDGVYIINTARGEVIDEDALYEACKSKKVAGACLDVFWEEPYKGRLLELDNVYFTPHIGGNTKEAQQRIGKELVERLKVILGQCFERYF